MGFLIDVKAARICRVAPICLISAYQEFFCCYMRRKCWVLAEMRFKMLKLQEDCEKSSFKKSLWFPFRWFGLGWNIWQTCMAHKSSVSVLPSWPVSSAQDKIVKTRIPNHTVSPDVTGTSINLHFHGLVYHFTFSGVIWGLDNMMHFVQLSDRLVMVYIFVDNLKDITPFKKTRLFCLLHCGLSHSLHPHRGFLKFIFGSCNYWWYEYAAPQVFASDISVAVRQVDFSFVSLEGECSCQNIKYRV